MTHWSPSRSNEYCSFDNTAIPLPCDAAKSCPISDGYAASLDTFSVKASMLPIPPDVTKLGTVTYLFVDMQSFWETRDSYLFSVINW